MEKTHLKTFTELIDWESDASHCFLNPRLSADQKKYFENLLAATPALKAHIWLASSGSRSSPRLLALSKKAFLVAASQVNKFLEAGANDSWLCVLPTFHVGGLSIYARAHLSGASVHFCEGWDPRKIATLMQNEGLHFASLVPTQIYDLVQHKIQAPDGLRGLIVGGDALNSSLYLSAQNLGWKVIRSYGMTESCALFAANREAHSPESSDDWLEILPHVKARLSSESELEIQSEALFSGEMKMVGGEPCYTPSPTGFFKTHDLAEIRLKKARAFLRILGRTEDLLKIGGEFVSLSFLNSELSKISQHATLVGIDDPRLGTVLHLALEKGAKTNVAVQSFLKSLRPFERPRSYSELEAFPRTSLGKIIKNDLRELIQCNNKNMPLG